jgi:hypothetical protein
VPEIPDLEKLPGLPCSHPCSPLPGLHHRVLDGGWPLADPSRPPVPPVPPAQAPAPATLPPPWEAGKEEKKEPEKDKQGPPDTDLPPGGLGRFRVPPG